MRTRRTGRDNGWRSDEAHELVLFADNDANLYRQKDAFLANMHRKMKRGTYDPAQGKKLWMYFVDRAAKAYVKEFGGGAWNVIFPRSARLEAAEHYEKEERGMIERGEYSKYPPVRTIHDARDKARRHRAKGAPTFAKQEQIAKKVRLLRKEGYPPKQAVAIAYRMAGVARKPAQRDPAGHDCVGVHTHENLGARMAEHVKRSSSRDRSRKARSKSSRRR